MSKCYRIRRSSGGDQGSSLSLAHLLVRKRIRGDLICLYKIIHGILGFPCTGVFVAHVHSGLRDHGFKVHQQWGETRHRQHAFSVRVVPYWNKLPEEIVKASSVEAFKLRVDARWQPFSPEAPLPNWFHPVASHPYGITVDID